MGCSAREERYDCCSRANTLETGLLALARQIWDYVKDCTCLYLNVRLSKVFLTKGDFFGRVELSLSLRYN